MFLIWSRWGFLIALILFIAFMIYGLTLGSFLHHQSVLMSGATIVCMAIICGGGAALGIFYLGRRLESRPPRVLIDPKTNKEVIFRKSAGSLFFVPWRHWPYITLAIWLLIAVSSFVNGDLHRP